MANEKGESGPNVPVYVTRAELDAHRGEIISAMREIAVAMNKLDEKVTKLGQSHGLVYDHNWFDPTKTGPAVEGCGKCPACVAKAAQYDTTRRYL